MPSYHLDAGHHSSSQATGLTVLVSGAQHEVKGGQVTSAPVSIWFGCTYRANVAHIRQSRTDSGLGFHVRVLESINVLPSLLGRGPERAPEEVRRQRLDALVDRVAHRSQHTLQHLFDTQHKSLPRLPLLSQSAQPLQSSKHLEFIHPDASGIPRFLITAAKRILHIKDSQSHILALAFR